MYNMYMRGFTIMELMIAIAIVGIIAAVAIPAYRGYIDETQSAAARANLSQLQLAIEDHWLDNQTYEALADNTWTGDGSTVTPPSPNPSNWLPHGDGAQYIYQITAATITGYSVRIKNIHGGTSATFTKN